jgi:2-C-methyl-D-erythritol 4-phosphate cytidylyltransferase/2-C-methyl-D-erythritol 2,4-cyclodiphosphate synthase
MDSRIFLEEACKMLSAKNGKIQNVDITIICEAPKIGPHRDSMRNKVAEILKIDSMRVNIKATTTEGLGFTGRKEGIAAQTVITIQLCHPERSEGSP